MNISKETHFALSNAVLLFWSRSGILQIGDRILGINGESTEGLTLDEVTSFISQSHSRVALIIEFDVAEAVVPSSGTFTVKLAKRGSDIGISVTGKCCNSFPSHFFYKMYS